MKRKKKREVDTSLAPTVLPHKYRQQEEWGSGTEKGKKEDN